MTIVTIEEGILRGNETNSENGCKIYEFFSIPYAKPPLGDLRFKNPQPLESWSGERDATKSNIANMSCQKGFVTGEITGSEDCLYLNVYTPHLPSSGSKLLPVMVYLHGGGFIYGSGIIKQELNPEFLVENDVVVVTINYRLGVLGFLSLDIPEASGNMGLKDQTKALQWVQKNIDRFGGDRNNVTLFGSSAGSASVEYQILSPMAKGLFQKAILQSGSALNDWAINNEYDKLTLALANKLEYKGDQADKLALYDFLMKVPAKELTEASFFVTENYTAKSIFFGFVPIVEKHLEDAFITTHPYKILKEGNFAKVPVIRGFCNKEGYLMNMMKPFAVNELIANKSFVNFWSYELDDSDKENYAKKFINAYLDTTKSNDDHDAFAVDFFGDLHLTAGLWLGSIMSAKHGISEYVYKFSYDGKLNQSKIMFGLMKKGAAHGDDIGYMFKSSILPAHPEENDVSFRATYTKMLTNFAKTSNPTPPGSLPINWPKFTDQSKIFINLNKKITTEANYARERMAIFEEIYEKYEK